ncbi:MAG: type II secretion system inner membrane protein GspF [Candidatus Omnitrophica bacterium]|nr:type II secretion system inner membrane protein GspF [Candidatus Omnitrophota bacterium]
MPRFIYKAKKSPTESTSGKIEAQDAKDAVVRLRRMGLFPVSIDEDSTFTKQQARQFFFFKKSVPLRDLSVFTRQLSNLLDSGIPLINALDILIQQSENPLLIDALKDIKSDIKDGAGLSVSMSKHPQIFSSLYTNMVKSGEVAGMLEDVLSRLADFAETDEQIISKIRTSLAYPALLLSVGSVTIFILLSFVAPRLISMFSDLGEALPIPTRILMVVSSFFSSFWWLIVIAVVIFYLSLAKWLKTKEGKKEFDKFKLKMPLIGPFIKISEYARLNRTLGTLIKNGVPIIESLDVLAKTIDNEVLREHLLNVRNDVVDGVSLSVSMKKTNIFPPLMVNMIGVGEESGSLEGSLFKIASSYDNEVDRIIKVFTTLLEPLLILVLGIVVGFIVIAMLLPIFQINMLVR